MRWKVQANVVTPQELKMVCGESNEINVTVEKKKMFAFDKGVEKCLIIKKMSPPPHVSNLP